MAELFRFDLRTAVLSSPTAQKDSTCTNLVCLQTQRVLGLVLSVSYELTAISNVAHLACKLSNLKPRAHFAKTCSSGCHHNYVLSAQTRCCKSHDIKDIISHVQPSYELVSLS